MGALGWFLLGVLVGFVGYFALAVYIGRRNRVWRKGR